MPRPNEIPMFPRVEASPMKKNGAMQRKALHAAVASAIAALAFTAGPAFADATSELKAEIAAQRAQLEQQRLRLEAMEKKLDAETGRGPQLGARVHVPGDAGGHGHLVRPHRRDDQRYQQLQHQGRSQA